MPTCKGKEKRQKYRPKEQLGLRQGQEGQREVGKWEEGERALETEGGCCGRGDRKEKTEVGRRRQKGVWLPSLPLSDPPLQGPYRRVLAAIDWTMALLSMSRSRALEAQPTTGGGRLLEKR